MAVPLRLPLCLLFLAHLLYLPAAVCGRVEQIWSMGQECRDQGSCPAPQPVLASATSVYLGRLPPEFKASVWTHILFCTRAMRAGYEGPTALLASDGN